MSRDDALKFLEDYECEEEAPVSKERRIVNPKDHSQVIVSTLSFEEAIEAAEKRCNDNDFAVRVIEAARRFGEDKIFPSYRYWLYRFAHEKVQATRKIMLQAGSCQQILDLFGKGGWKHPLFQWRVLNEKGEVAGKVKIFPKNDKIIVLCGNFFYGEIRSDDHFYPSNYCQDGNDVIAQLAVLSLDPKGFLLKWGKDTGYCCICGILLTDETSVRNGIGPICAGRLGW